MEMGSKNLFPIASSVSSPLFPAYSAGTSGNNVPENSDRDWLTNSSYAPENYQSIVTKLAESSESEIEVLKVEVKSKDKKKSKHHKKIKKEHHKKSSAPPQEKFQVPESDSIRNQLNKKVFIEETGLSYERAFRIDANKDPENIYYDCLEQKNIAKYRLYPKYPVGCNAVEQSLWINTSNVSKNETPRYFSKKALKLIKKSECEEEICVAKEIPSLDVTLQYIPLAINSKLAPIARTDLKANFEGVSLSWKAEYSKTHESKKKQSEDKDVLETTSDSELRNKTITFNKKLAEFPHDIQLWLNFVDFQDELHESQGSEISTKSQAESYLIEKKIAILEKALRHNPKSVQLNVAKLNLSRNLWKIEKVIKCWEELIFLYPNNPQIWQEYVTFVLTDLTYFSTPRVLKIYSKCLRTFSDLSEGIIESHERPPDIILSMLDIFSQLCFVMKSCGYTEKAIAAFQSLIEFNLFSFPSMELLSVSEQISFFEPFWDSGAPRFGEESAIGWERTISQQKIVNDKLVSQSDLSGIEDEILYQRLPDWATWIQFERLREEHHWLPWRPNPEYDQTEDDIDDVDRTISFDDISQFLFRIPDEGHKFLLIQDFIKFLGFNSHHFECSFFDNPKNNVYINISNFDVVSKRLHSSLFNNELSNPLCFESAYYTEHRMGFVKNMISQAVPKFSSKYKMLLSLICLRYLKTASVECCKEFAKIDNAKKYTKNVLKDTENRNCLLLWFEYIQMEILSGSKKKAKKTVETLMTSSSLAVANGSMPLKELWYFIRSYIDLCLSIQTDCNFDDELFSSSEIMWLLIHIASKGSYVTYSNELIKPSMILKAFSGFKNCLEEELQSVINTNFELCYCLDPCEYSALDCAKCFAYLQYFTKGLEAAVNVLKDTAEFLESKCGGRSKSYLLEKIYIFETELMNFHVWNATASIKPLQLYLYDAVEKFPSSAGLLYVLAKLRTASSVVSHTRRFFAKILRQHHKIQPITWIFAIASELSLSYSISDQKTMNGNEDFQGTVQSFSGMKWKIRALYERALNSSLCSHIPVIWRSYMKFEMLNQEIQRAKSILNRAMQHCGWSKELIMDGIEFFPDDLKQTIDFMVEKQIRVHTPLEEVTLLMEHGVQNL